ncbi:MAG: aldose epimerase [Cyanobacteria bacterium P01_D01_bin.105]
MYAISKKEEQYDTYILNDQTSGARLEVVPERGGIITRWDIADTPITYLNEERFKDASKSVRGGFPILFPICGNLVDNQYDLNGQTYTLQQHGFAREMAWQVIDKGVRPDTDSAPGGAFIQLQLTSTPETLAKYPFEFELQYTYWLQGNRVTIEQHFINRAAQSMPFAAGLHPYFFCDHDAVAKSKLSLDFPATQYNDNIDKKDKSYDGALNWNVPEIDVAFHPLSAQKASVTDPNRGVSVVMDYDTPFNTLVFWTVEGKSFYCLEPWSAPRHVLNTGVDVITLAPGESKTLTVTFTASIDSADK